MASKAQSWLDRAIPDLPDAIRDDYFVHAAKELQRQSPWLFRAMFINSIIAMVAGAEAAHPFVRYALPTLMACYCVFSLFVLRSDWQFDAKPWRARKFLFESSLSSCFGALICTSWCILSWLAAPVEARMHFPIILVMGGIATAFCLSSVKIGAIANLVIDLVPISLLMMFSGNPAELAAALSLALAGGFQYIMISANQSRIIQLLTLQQQARQQAHTDPLTGLANRRAVFDRLRHPTLKDTNCGLMIIDIDHFKAINDEWGHEMGDQVLCEIAEIIASHAIPGVLPARIGGEEFALLGPVENVTGPHALALLQDVRTAPMPNGQQVTVSIGLSEGVISCEESWRKLYQRADAALYRAKSEGRNQLCQGDSNFEGPCSGKQLLAEPPVMARSRIRSR
ncbi:GGDEF domain-containing protein [Erythrobacter mangrovi]|uniref:diguanylate cyclase n=1 Tax=Erythrobacter mangrovi TaxID=2739433 RepID=A0A7D3XW77_9SPHN|nr:diguanylate cyclase [Erythrobacter mangrovi]QKG71756.1 diguanylate cyclase [Erythrobacter mangrovi]